MAVLHAKGGPAEDKQAEDSCSTFTASKHMDSALLLLYLSSLLAPPVLSVVATSLVGHLRTRAIPLNAPCHPEADGHLTGGLAISMAISTAASNAISRRLGYEPWPSEEPPHPDTEFLSTPIELGSKRDKTEKRETAISLGRETAIRRGGIYGNGPTTHANHPKGPVGPSRRLGYEPWPLEKPPHPDAEFHSTPEKHHKQAGMWLQPVGFFEICVSAPPH